MKGAIEYQERRDGAATLIRLAGALDEASAKAIESRLLGAVEDADDEVRLDLSGITFVDSTGLGLLVRAARCAMREDKAFAVVQLSDVMEAQFERARLRALLVGSERTSQATT